jgi:hypothetical protein
MKTVLDTLRHTAIFVVLAFLASGTSNAHPGHGDPLSQDAAVQRAWAEIARLVERGKLDKSWKLNAVFTTAELRGSDSGKEWAVIFSNAMAPAETERILYVFLTEQGEYVAANFSGK